MAFVAIIPARGGSKSIPRKNLAQLGGKALIDYTFDAALQARSIDRIVVSTDDEEIAAHSFARGISVPALRPPGLAADDTPMIAVLAYELERLRQQSIDVEGIVLLQPTSPLRRADHIDSAIAQFREGRYTSVVSMVPVPHQFNPLSVMCLHDGLLRPFLDQVSPTRRQDKPLVYARNGPAILVVHPETIAAGHLYGDRCAPFFMEWRNSIDIDTSDDLHLAEWVLGCGSVQRT